MKPLVSGISNSKLQTTERSPARTSTPVNGSELWLILGHRLNKSYNYLQNKLSPLIVRQIMHKAVPDKRYFVLCTMERERERERKMEALRSHILDPLKCK